MTEPSIGQGITETRPRPRPVRQSIQPTYDSRKTGPRFTVSSRIGDTPVGPTERISDPFVRHTIRIEPDELRRGLDAGVLFVSVTVDGDPSVVDDVLELDANTLIANSTRRRQFDAETNAALSSLAVAPDGS